MRWLNLHARTVGLALALLAGVANFVACGNEAELVQLRLFPCELEGVEPRSVVVELTGFDEQGELVETFEVTFDDITAKVFDVRGGRVALCLRRRGCGFEIGQLPRQFGKAVGPDQPFRGGRAHAARDIAVPAAQRTVASHQPLADRKRLPRVRFEGPSGSLRWFGPCGGV